MANRLSENFPNKKKKKKKKKNKSQDWPGDFGLIKILEDEISMRNPNYKSMTQDISHTAISWLEHRLNMLKGIEDDDS